MCAEPHTRGPRAPAPRPSPPRWRRPRASGGGIHPVAACGAYRFDADAASQKHHLAHPPGNASSESHDRSAFGRCQALLLHQKGPLYAVLTALRFASLPRQLAFDAEARERWIEIYGPLSRGEQGLLGAAIRRAEAHVVRLAAIYATLDCSPAICLPHLEAALAVWRYSADSARWIFGDSLGDPTADEIWALAKTRSAGVTRTEVRDLFSRNKKAREIERALTALEEAGRLHRTTITDGRGRPSETWLPAAPPRAA